ncbi:hypothetical protein ACIP6X_27720 [Streptomyces coeruleorubidus]
MAAAAHGGGPRGRRGRGQGVRDELVERRLDGSYDRVHYRERLL